MFDMDYTICNEWNSVCTVHEMHDKQMHQVLLFYRIFYWTSISHIHKEWVL